MCLPSTTAFFFKIHTNRENINLRYAKKTQQKPSICRGTIVPIKPRTIKPRTWSPRTMSGDYISFQCITHADCMGSTNPNYRPLPIAQSNILGAIGMSFSLFLSSRIFNISLNSPLFACFVS